MTTEQALEHMEALAREGLLPKSVNMRLFRAMEVDALIKNEKGKLEAKKGDILFMHGLAPASRIISGVEAAQPMEA